MHHALLAWNVFRSIVYVAIEIQENVINERPPVVPVRKPSSKTLPEAPKAAPGN